MVMKKSLERNVHAQKLHGAALHIIILKEHLGRGKAGALPEAKADKLQEYYCYAIHKNNGNPEGILHCCF